MPWPQLNAQGTRSQDTLQDAPAQSRCSLWETLLLASHLQIVNIVASSVNDFTLSLLGVGTVVTA